MSCGCSLPNQSNGTQNITSHPCYDLNAHHYFARIHLPVAPACNIQCNYCNKKFDCSNESRPGVTSKKLKPIEAIKKLLFVGSKIKQLSVIGIAGPGDALANPKQTFETLELVKKYAPDLKLCISTNGLMLPFYATKLKELGVDHITITINTLNPETGAKIYPWVYDTISKKRLKGIDGAKLLLKRQLEGLQKCLELGMLVKINSVLIPEINKQDIIELSKELKKMGVFIHNIMPLLSDPSFGTYFGLNGIRSATQEELQEVQKECELDMHLMTHCKQCRSDAIGLLGEDRGREFDEIDYSVYTFEELTKMYDLDGRVRFQETIKEFVRLAKEGNQKVKEEILVAVTSSNNLFVDQHFGGAKSFFIYKVSKDEVKFYDKRVVENSYCSGFENCGNNNPIEAIKEALKDCKLLITEKIGLAPKQELEKIGIICDESFGQRDIKKALLEALKIHFKLNITLSSEIG